MAEYHPLHRIDSDPSGGFSLFIVRTATLDRNLTLKVCDCHEIADADLLLKSAFRKVISGSYESELVDLYLGQGGEAGDGGFTVNFVWDRQGDAVDSEVIRKCETGLPSGKQGYRNKELKSADSNTEEKVKDAWSEPLQQTVTIKKYLFSRVADVNSALKEALVQAKVTHQNIGRLIDVCLTKTKKKRIRLHVVMEKMKGDMEEEVERRAAEQRFFTEEELLQILSDLLPGLLHAKSKAVSHSHLSPISICQGLDGHFKVINFASAKKGAEKYQSPLRGDNFSGDVFALGMCMLFLGKLGQLQRTLTETSEELRTIVKKEVVQLRYSDEFKRLLLGLLSIDPSQRPSLSNIQELTSQLLDSTQKLNSQAIDLATVGLSKLKANDYEGAEHYMEAADELLGRQFWTDIGYPTNLTNWADVARVTGDKEKAMEKYEKADVVFKKFHPEALNYAICLGSWGLFLMNTGQSDLALQKLESADSIYLRFPSDLNNANNKMNLADLFRRTNQLQKAIEKYRLANEIFAKFHMNELNYAVNVINWGLALKNNNEYRKALKKYELADSLLAWLKPSSIYAATNLYNWGCLFEQMRQPEKAMVKIQAAHSVFVLLNSPKAETHTGRVLLRLQKAIGGPNSPRKLKQTSPRHYNSGPLSPRRSNLTISTASPPSPRSCALALESPGSPQISEFSVESPPSPIRVSPGLETVSKVQLRTGPVVSSPKRPN